MSSSSNCENSSSATSIQCAMKKENDGILSNEDDNRSSSQKHSDVKSRKRNEPEDVADHLNEPSSNKKVRVFVASSPHLDLPASFNTLDDDCLGNVLDFVGKKCYSVFGRVNKRCHEMFCSKGLPKETYLYGYGPLRLIQQQYGRGYESKLSEGVLHFNRRDILEWMLTDKSEDGYWRLKHFCHYTIEESRLDILHEVFQRVNEEHLLCLRDCKYYFDLYYTAAHHGKLECLKLLRENKCEWGQCTWFFAKVKGHEHILEYMRDNGYPTELQN